MMLLHSAEAASAAEHLPGVAVQYQRRAGEKPASLVCYTAL
jgi:hypothetical protein